MRFLSGVLSVCVFWIALAAISPASAHHSAARFDRSQTVEVNGTVIDYELRSPHSYVMIDDEAGTRWVVETDAIHVLVRSGWSADSFAPGDRVSARINPSRSAGDYHALLVSIRSAEDRVLESYNVARRDHDIEFARSSSLAGVWTSTFDDSIGFYFSWRDHELTQAGHAAQAAFAETPDASANCDPFPTPFLMASNYWHMVEVEMAEEKIVFRSELYGAERIVFMDGRRHPADGEHTVQGHSIGRWEGNTLVIDSMLFSPHPSPVGNFGIPSGTQKHVVERLTLSEDGSRVSVELFVEDPEYLAEPFSSELTWIYAPNLAFTSAACSANDAQPYIVR